MRLSPRLAVIAAFALAAHASAATYSVTNTNEQRRRLPAPGDPRRQCEPRHRHDHVRDSIVRPQLQRGRRLHDLARNATRRRLRNGYDRRLHADRRFRQHARRWNERRSEDRALGSAHPEPERPQLDRGDLDHPRHRVRGPLGRGGRLRDDHRYPGGRMFFGIDADGLTANACETDCISTFVDDSVLIGGPSLADRNLFGSSDVFIATEASTHMTVRNNLFGTDRTGAVALPSFIAIFTDRDTTNFSALDNVIDGCTNEGMIFGASSTVKGNFIGVDATGTIPLPDRSRASSFSTTPRSEAPVRAKATSSVDARPGSSSREEVTETPFAATRSTTTLPSASTSGRPGRQPTISPRRTASRSFPSSSRSRRARRRTSSPS